eukprot:Trichotokara_eunicae@DN4033_c0_g1_i1.p2
MSSGEGQLEKNVSGKPVVERDVSMEDGGSVSKQVDNQMDKEVEERLTNRILTRILPVMGARTTDSMSIALYTVTFLPTLYLTGARCAFYKLPCITRVTTH